jgi:glyoxylase-like metal-dependent hydrolase (beta-lactamase superfamily II)
MPSRLAQLVPGVWVATSRRYATTSTVLLDGAGGAVVVDPAWDPDELAAIPADLTELGIQCVAGVATHEHYDHVMWHPLLGGVPRWSTAGTVERLSQHREALLAPLAQYLSADLIAIAGRLQPLDSDRVAWDGPPTRIVVHDAHAPQHLALVLEEPAVIVCGDMLSDVELPMPADDDVTLENYLTGLERLREAVVGSDWLIPGHGNPTEQPLARYDADMRYLEDLMAGRTPDDPRVVDPDNQWLHQANLRRAEAARASG